MQTLMYRKVEEDEKKQKKRNKKSVSVEGIKEKEEVCRGYRKEDTEKSKGM